MMNEALHQIGTLKGVVYGFNAMKRAIKLDGTGKSIKAFL